MLEKIFLKEIQKNHKTNPLEDTVKNLSKINMAAPYQGFVQV